MLGYVFCCIALKIYNNTSVVEKVKESKRGRIEEEGECQWANKFKGPREESCNIITKESSCVDAECRRCRVSWII